jgi:hypothetical protein
VRFVHNINSGQGETNFPSLFAGKAQNVIIKVKRIRRNNIMTVGNIPLCNQVNLILFRDGNNQILPFLFLFPNKINI